MSDQLALAGTGIPVPPDVKLTGRQRLALDHIGTRGPVPSDELGALLHEHRDPAHVTHHPRDERCDFCRSEGASIGARLRDHGLVRYSRKRSGWVLSSTAGEPRRPDGHDPASGEIPY